MHEFKRLFEPIRIGQLELKNRIWGLAYGTFYGDYDQINDRLIDHIAERARGGAGIVWVPHSVIYQGYHLPGELPYYQHHLPGIYEDALIPDIRRLVDAIHQQDGKAGCQLRDGDKWAAEKSAPLEFVSPSGVSKAGSKNPRPLAVSELSQIVMQYADAALRAKEAGYDAVEIACNAGYLMAQFLSPYTNKRTDRYGGPVENRTRLLCEIITAIRENVGNGYPISCRIIADDFLEGGNTLEDGKQIAAILEKAGADVLNVQPGWLESPKAMIQACVPPGAFAYIAEEIKKVVRIPVVTAFRINDPEVAERILEEGQADLIGMCRALIADPEFPNKARQGRFEDIRKCIACGNCMDATHARPQVRPLSCAINPVAGHESEYIINPAESPKKVFIVGGGPGGMQAAIVAAQRGHAVTLFDRNTKLVGQLLTAIVPPDKQELAGFIDYLVRQVESSCVEVHLGSEVSAEEIVAQSPDTVIVAAGAVPLIPVIEGVELSGVVTAVDILRGLATVGQKVAIIGGGLVGCETGLYLAEKGRQVVIMEMLDQIGADIGISTRWVILSQLLEAGVTMYPKSKVTRINSHGVQASREGKEVSIEADTVVLAVGMKSDPSLVKKLQGEVEELYPIGDCVRPRRLREAIEEGFRVGLQV